MAVLGLTNAPAVSAIAAYARTSEAIGASEIRLSAGTRIIQAGDDSASLSSATRLQTQNSTLRSALQNGAHAMSLLQVAYDGLTAIRDILDSLSALTTTANQSGLTSRQYITLNAAFQTQLAQIDSIATTTTYNGAKLLDGTTSGGGAPVYQLGSPASSTLSVAIANVTSASLFPAPVSLSNSANAATATTQVSTAQNSINTAIAQVEAYQARIDTAEAAARQNISGINNGISGLIGTDSVSETNNLTHNQLQQQTAAAIIAQAMGLNSSLLKLVH